MKWVKVIIEKIHDLMTVIFIVFTKSTFSGAEHNNVLESEGS